MKTYQFIREAKDGKLIIEVPEELNEKELKVVVSIQKPFDLDEKIEKFHELPVEERLKVLAEFCGKNKYPNADINKYDVYEQ